MVKFYLHFIQTSIPLAHIPICFFTLAKYLFKWSQIKLESTFLGKNTAVQNESYILGRILKVLFTLKVICMSCDEIISRMKMTYQLLFNGCASYKK